MGYLNYRTMCPAVVKDEAAIMWYKLLDSNQRIIMKLECQTVLGMGFELLSICFSLLEIITLFYRKLLGEPL